MSTKFSSPILLKTTKLLQHFSKQKEEVDSKYLTLVGTKNKGVGRKIATSHEIDELLQLNWIEINPFLLSSANIKKKKKKTQIQPQD